ncbi:hypothetical protein FYJ61_09485, partial [Lactobacillus equicursoris]|nr:hypothetical protein [Lactobacillus equicursoris]
KYGQSKETKTVKRTITYQDTDKKPVNGSPNGTSSYEQEVIFTRTALKDNNGKIVGYDKNGDGKVDTTDASAAWVTSKDSMDEVVSKTPSSVGYDMVDKSSVTGVSNITPDQKVDDVVVTYSKYGKSTETKTVKRTITYQDTDKKPVKGSPNGTSSYEQEVTFTRTALKDNNGKIVGYDKNGDGKVDTTDASAAWVTSKDSMDEVVSKTPSSVGYDMVDQSSVAGVTSITPDQKLTDVVVTYSKYGKSTETKTVKRTITYQDTDKKPVNGSPDGKSSYVQEVTFTRTALKDNDGKIVGYDKNGDGKVDTTDADQAWVTSKDSMDEVASKTPSDVGYDMVDMSSVAGVTNITPGQKVDDVVVTYSKKYHTDVESKNVNRTIEYYDSVTNTKIPSNLEDTVTQTATLARKKIFDSQNKFIGYGTISEDGTSYKLDDGWTVESQTWIKQDSKNLKAYGYTDPDKAFVEAAIVDGNTEDTTVKVYYGHQYESTTIYKPGTQIVHYVDNNGNKVFEDKVQTDDKAFSATQTTDKVTGVVTTSAWTGTKTFDEETTPFKDDYHADRKTAGGLAATVENPNVEDKVVYTPNGKLIPVDPEGNKIPNAPTPTIPTDPKDPTKTVPSTDIPDVPNWTPVNPGKTDTPKNPSDDKKVPYTNYCLTEKYVDTEGKELLPSVTRDTRYTTGEKYDVTKDTKVIPGYVLIKTTDTTGTFAHSDKTAVFTYQKVGKIVPVDKDSNPIPGADTPSYHNDPKDPSKVTPNEDIPTVPGYTPVDPSSVTPKDPTKDTLVPYSKNEKPSEPVTPVTPEAKYGLTEKFVDESGKELLPSENKGTDYKTGDSYDVTGDAKKIDGYELVKTTDIIGTFAHSNKTAVFTYKKVETPVTPVTPVPTFGLTEKFVDENGKELLPSENKGTSYKTGDKYDVTKDAKVIDGYVLTKTTDTTGTFDRSDKTAVFTYQKVGKIVPVDQHDNPIPNADTPSYHNDLTNPAQVIPEEPVPSVPGYTPSVPQVTPTEPTKDTPVPYSKDVTPVAKHSLTEKFVDESGKELLPSVTKGTDYKTGDSYDVTSDAKKLAGYKLVKTTDATGTFGDGDKVAVFTYQKVEKAKKPQPAKKAPSQPTKPGTKDRKTISRPTGPNTPGMTNETEVSTSTLTKSKTPSRSGSPLAPGQVQAATTNTDRARLPQTGSDNEQSKLLTGLGLAALAATALLTVLDIKKRKN